MTNVELVRLVKKLWPSSEWEHDVRFCETAIRGTERAEMISRRDDLRTEKRRIVEVLSGRPLLEAAEVLVLAMGGNESLGDSDSERNSKAWEAISTIRLHLRLRDTAKELKSIDTILRDVPVCVDVRPRGALGWTMVAWVETNDEAAAKCREKAPASK